MSLKCEKSANHLDVKNRRRKRKRGKGLFEIRIHSLERNPNLQKVLITVALPRPCWKQRNDLFVAWPWQSYSLLQGENWKVIAGNDTLTLKLKSVYFDSCHCFLFFFFFWSRKKMSLEFHSFKIQTSQIQSSAGRWWVQWIFPTITTTIPFGRWRSIGPASQRITSLIISYLIQLSLKSMGIFLLISVELYWALSMLSVSFPCIKTAGFAIRLLSFEGPGFANWRILSALAEINGIHRRC